MLSTESGLMKQVPWSSCILERCLTPGITDTITFLEQFIKFEFKSHSHLNEKY